MKPWSYDAGELNPQEIPEAYIFKNETISSYLSAGSHERKLFLIGPKGSGKTLLLRYKAYQYWKKLSAEEGQAYQASESGELVQSLDFRILTLTEKELHYLAKHQVWVNIWEFALSLIILRRAKILTKEAMQAFPEELQAQLGELDELFPSHFGLSDIVSKLINQSSRFLFSKFFAINTDLTALLKLIKNTFVLFIDRLDQGLNRVLQNEDYRYLDDQRGDNIPFLVWRGAQFGLLETIYNINTALNSHIKIFATARSEALGVESQLRQNILNYCTHLQYSREELRQIFINNITLLPAEHLHGARQQQDWLYRFFGFTDMPHLKARDVSNQPRSEGVFEFLCRHTFERPREVVMLGKQIYDELVSRPHYRGLSELSKIEQVRRIVNDTSHSEVLRDYLTEVVPGFKSEFLDIFSHQIRENVLTRDELLEIDPDVVNYLYRIGLIGCLVNNRQVFLQASKFIHDKREIIRNVDYYFVHPAIDRRLQAIKNFNVFYNKYNIVGNQYEFFPPPPFSPDVWLEKDLSYFMPAQLPGKSENTNGHHFNIEVPLPDLFEAFFLKSTEPEVVAFKKRKMEDVFRLLSCVADLHFLHKLRGRFRAEFNGWAPALEQQLDAFRGRNDFTATITGLTTEDLINFGYRLFGRIFTAGSHIFLRLELPAIHSIIRNYTFDSQALTVEMDSALRYLRRAFFLRGLRPTPPETADERKQLLNTLSPFEKDHLIRWWAYYRNHELLINAHLREEHIRHLKQELLDGQEV